MMDKVKLSELERSLKETQDIIFSDVEKFRHQIAHVSTIYKDNPKVVGIFRQMSSELGHYLEEISDLKTELEDTIRVCIKQSQEA